MKIALCISGQPRGIPLSCEKMKWGIIDPNEDVDVFFHTWFNPENAGQPFTGAQPAQANIIGKVHPNTPEILLEQLKPRLYIIEPQRKFDWAKNLKQASSAVQEQLASMFYSMWVANSLRKQFESNTGTQYDCVVRVRFDLVYDQQIRFEDYKQYLQDYIVTSQKFQDERENPHFQHGDYTLTDIFAFSSPQNMDIFSGTYPVMSLINSKISPPFGENYLGFQVKVMNKLKVKTVPITYEIMHRVIDLNTVK